MIKKKQINNKIFFFLKENFIIILIWLLGLTLRCYRQQDLLGFYYDQGRDAKMAADIIDGSNFPAIGPTTGIQGLLLGPFWYYLITPGYFFGSGDPVVASLFICLLESLTIPLMFFILKNNWNKSSAYFGASIWAFSFYLIKSSRWFSNPSPLPFFVVLMIFLLLKVFKENKHKYLILIFFLLGLTLQLEAASAVFFIPIIGLLLFFNLNQTKKIGLKNWILSIFTLGSTFLPQLAFEFKNNFLVTKNLIGFLTGKINSNTGKSWAIPDFGFIKTRLMDYYQTFFSQLDINVTFVSILFLIIFIVGLVLLFKFHFKNNLVKILLIWFFVPLIFLLFFVGNFGHLYGYYLTGYFPVFVMLFAIILFWPKKIFISKFLFLLFIPYFYLGNFPSLVNFLSTKINAPGNITLGSQTQAVNFICQKTKLSEYNLNIYVPPVVPHAYEYLFKWYSKRNRCHLPNSNQVGLNYILYEIDPPHPERLMSWLQSADSTAKILEETNFGGIFIQKRERLNYEK